MTGKAKRAQSTLEFKLEAVRLVKNGQSLAVVSATLGVVQQTLHNWVKAHREGNWVGLRRSRSVPNRCPPAWPALRDTACGDG
jgi:transposase-like protein